MKKLIMAVAMVCAAAIAQAASFNWIADDGKLMIGDATTAKYDGSGWLIDAASLSQNTLVAAITAGGVNATYLENNAIAGSVGRFESGKQEGLEFSYDVSKSFSAYFVCIQDDGKVFISDTIDSGYSAADTQDIRFENYATDSKMNSFKNATSFGEQGWYYGEQIEPTPEPTSGLLLVLGLAGLALRRAAADAPCGLGLSPSAPSKPCFSLGRA